MPHWISTAYILIVEHRTCRTCRTVYKAPALSTRVLLERSSGNRTSSRTIPIEEYARHLSSTTPVSSVHAVFLPTLPRLIQDIQISIPTCPACFQDSPATQSDLWPKRPPNTLSVASIEASRKRDSSPPKPVVIAASLDDIP